MTLLLYSAGGFAEEPSIKSITRASTMAKMTWGSEFGNGYRLLASASPGGPWEHLGNLMPGTEAEMSAYDDMQGVSKRFYRLEVTDITPAAMVAIAGGTYDMGDHFATDVLYSDAGIYSLPLHTVTLDSFYMDTTEVTNADFCAFLNAAKRAGEVQVDLDAKGRVFSTADRDVVCAEVRYFTEYKDFILDSDLLYDTFSGATRVEKSASAA